VTAGIETYEDLRQRGIEAGKAGHLEESLGHFESAWKWARANGGEVLEHRAYLNRSTVLIALGGSDEVLPRLREILVRNLDAVNCRLAAYNIARIYEHRKETKKGLFYARIASSWTGTLEAPDPEWVASDHNQAGNFLVAESRFEEAADEYQKALNADPDAPPGRRALVCQNLGYCLLVLTSYRRGFELLYRALRSLRHLGAENQQTLVHLDLAYGHLEVGRHRDAERHAARALALAERFGDRDGLKNALYLAGEAANLQGKIDDAREHFGRLQKYFPETPFVTDFLLAIDIRKIINLRA
jgi:tetratricopeptide (TPR) repeat protein